MMMAYLLKYRFLIFLIFLLSLIIYGDISFRIPQSRYLAVLLSSLGPMHVAVMVARMVGKYSSTFKSKE